MKIEKPLLQVLNNKTPSRRPIWLMRQAGRYLPEYRELRAEAGSFLSLCYNPRQACEVTLQPLRRFDLDAAILFSDILVIPKALGSDVRFETGEGPKLSLHRDMESINKLDTENVLKNLENILETVSLISSSLDDKTTLIGFCGAPWTVATYMIEGGSSPDHINSKQAALGNEEWFGKLIDILTDASIEYLVAQHKAGAEVLQIFDSWAGSLGVSLYQKWCIGPVAKIVQEVKLRTNNAPVIGFPKGMGISSVDFADQTEIDCLGVDWQSDIHRLADLVDERVSLQGNIDPISLIQGGDGLKLAVEDLVKKMPMDRHVLNLGHGIKPETPISHVEDMIKYCRDIDNVS